MRCFLLFCFETSKNQKKGFFWPLQGPTLTLKLNQPNHKKQPSLSLSFVEIRSGRVFSGSLLFFKNLLFV